MASRAQRFDGTDFRGKQAAPSLGWPVPLESLQSVGQSVMADRGNGNPHKGVDIFADSEARVLAAAAGRVLRVVDGRKIARDSAQRAGLWVDIEGDDGRVYRYLHLGSAAVKDGQRVAAGAVVGTVSPAGDSGVEHSKPHVHFEVRAGDVRQRGKERDYGAPLDPLRLLPPMPLA